MSRNGEKTKIEADYKLVNDGMGLTIETLFKGMEGLVQSKTVVGEPIHVDGITLVPLIEVSAGLASGALGKSAKQNGAGAMSAKISPVALLVVQDGHTRLVSVKNPDVFSRLLDLIPEAVDKITGGTKPDERAQQRANDMLDTLETQTESADALEAELKKKLDS